MLPLPYLKSLACFQDNPANMLALPDGGPAHSLTHLLPLLHPSLPPFHSDPLTTLLLVVPKEPPLFSPQGLCTCHSLWDAGCFSSFDSLTIYYLCRMSPPNPPTNQRLAVSPSGCYAHAIPYFRFFIALVTLCVHGLTPPPACQVPQRPVLFLVGPAPAPLPWWFYG